MKDMVEVILWENGTYEVKDTDPRQATQRLYRYNGSTGLGAELYICPKDRWETYLMRLLSTKDIDKKIKELQKQKKAMEKLKAEIAKDLEGRTEQVG